MAQQQEDLEVQQRPVGVDDDPTDFLVVDCLEDRIGEASAVQRGRIDDGEWNALLASQGRCVPFPCRKEAVGRTGRANVVQNQSTHLACAKFDALVPRRGSVGDNPLRWLKHEDRCAGWRGRGALVSRYVCCGPMRAETQV